MFFKNFKILEIFNKFGKSGFQKFIFFMQNNANFISNLYLLIEICLVFFYCKYSTRT